MTDPSRRVLTYWLLPAAPAREFLSGTIRKLARQYQAPIFAPHLTLGLGPDEPGAADRVLARSTAGPIELRTQGLAHSSQFTRTLYLRCQVSDPLLELRRSLGLAEPAEAQFEPHLSLLYQNLPPEKRAQLQATLAIPFPLIRFDALQAVSCQLPIETPADVADWKPVACRSI